MINFSLVSWGPTLLVRIHGWSITQTGSVFGVMAMSCGVLGMLIVPLMTDMFGAKKSHSIRAIYVLRFCAVVGGVSAIIAPLSPSPWVMLIIYCPAYILLTGLSVLPPIIVQESVPNQLRSQMVAIYVLATNVIGLGFGPVMIGVLNDSVFKSADALPLSFATLATLSLIIGSTLLFYTRTSDP